MDCPDCERVATVVHEANAVPIVAPTAFTLEKVRAAALAFGLAPAPGEGPETIRLEVPRAACPPFAAALEQRLSIEERRQARARLLPAGAPLTLRAALETRPLQALIGRIKAGSRRSGWSP